MVTTRRSSEQMSSYDGTQAGGSVQLLERPVAQAPVTTEANDVERQKRQQNLAKLLNYDRYSEQAVAEPVVEEVAVQTQASLADEDIRPTSTTMQFGEDIDQIREEMRQVAASEEMSYKLNGKGRVVAILYSLAITIILALIVLNTGVLASLSKESASKSAELNNAVAKYNAIQTEIERVSSDEYVIDMAQSMGMVKGN